MSLIGVPLSREAIVAALVACETVHAECYGPDALRHPDMPRGMEPERALDEAIATLSRVFDALLLERDSEVTQ